MMHLHPNPDINPYAAEEYERESFAPINDEAKTLGIPIKTMYKISHDITKEVVQTVNRGGYDLLLVGVGPSIFKGSILGNLLGFTARALNPEKLYETITGKDRWNDALLSETTKEFIEESRCSVGIFIDKKFVKAENIFIPIYNVGDLFLTYYIKQLVQNEKIKLNVLDILRTVHNDARLKEEMNNILNISPEKIQLTGERKMDREFFAEQDLMIISFESWKRLVESESAWLANIPATLIIKP
jgi:hypothetical protein